MLLQVTDFAEVPEVADLSTSALATMIAEAEATVKALYIPTLHDERYPHKDAAKAIIKRAIIFDVENKTRQHGPRMQTAGNYQMTEFSPSRPGSIFNTSQAEDLMLLREKSRLPGAYSIRVSR